MSERILVNGKQTDRITVNDRGLNYGDGLFETIAISNGELLNWCRHMQRLTASCQTLGIPEPDIHLLNKECLSLCEQSEKAVIKILISRGSGGRGYAPPSSAMSRRMISLHHWPDHPSEWTSRGIDIRLCQFRYGHQPQLAGIKHLNRLEQVLARAEWQDSEHQEGLVLDIEDRVIEGTMSNLFVVNGKDLLTPDLTRCGIKGCIRETLIELAPAKGFNIEITGLSLNDIYAADEVFLCNSIIGIWPVKRLEQQTFLPGEVTKQLQSCLIAQDLICPL